MASFKAAACGVVMAEQASAPDAAAFGVAQGGIRADRATV